MLRRTTLAGIAVIALVSFSPSPLVSGGSIPQGTQTNAQYGSSGSGVTAVSATTQQISCYRPLVPYAGDNGPNDGYTGQSVCPGATTGEAQGPYPTQAGANAGYPAASAMLVKDHSESDIRVDPLNALHLIGTSKWFVSAEGYNHLLGFYESFDGGVTWPVQGHIPGYEGWTDNTDPIGSFDRYGNFYLLNLPYQFFYNADGTHNFAINPNKEPNPSQPAEVISVSVRPHGAATATDWLVTHDGHPDIVAAYPNKGNEPDKQWVAIDGNLPSASPFSDRIYAMWVDFTGCCTPHPVVSWATALPGGTHTDWSTPVKLPVGPAMPQGATYLLPHVAPDGTLWTTLTNGGPAHQYASDKIIIDRSTDGGVTWTIAGVVAGNIVAPPFRYPNTTFRDGILNSFAIGATAIDGHYYVGYEDAGDGPTSVLLTASYDDGVHWSSPIRVNDNPAPADAFQPSLAVAANGTVGVAFYDRRLACPARGSDEATGAGIALDLTNPNFAATPPYEAANYCVNASVQFYAPDLTPKGHNIRLSAHTFDPQLNAPHTGCATCLTTFLGDYFGFDTAGTTGFFTFVSTYNDAGTNPHHYQQQIVASLAIP